MKRIFLFFLVLLTLTHWIHTEAQVVQPTVTITPPSGDQDGPFDVTITFSRGVNRFEAGDITFDPVGASVSNFTGSNGDTEYTATIKPKTTGPLTIKVEADVATDAINNSGNESGEVTVAINLPMAIMVMDPEKEHNNEPFDVVFMFTESVELGDITLRPSNLVTLTDVDRSGPTITVTLTPRNNVDGELTISIAAGDALNDMAISYPASNSVTTQVDTIRPTVESIAVPSTPQNDAFDVTITFSEEVNGFDVDNDIEFEGSANVTASLKSGTDGNEEYEVTITPTNSGNLKIKVRGDAVTDDAGNESALSDTEELNIDTDAPTVTISDGPGTEQKDPFDLTIEFNEDVTGFTTDDLTVTGEATATNVFGSGTDYTVTITPNPNQEDDVTVQVNANAVIDTAENGNTASAATGNIHVDTIVPTASISDPPGTVQQAAFDLTISFEEAVTGFGIDDVNLTGPATKSLKSSSSDNTTFVVTITPNADVEGDVKVKVNADAVTDDAGNGNPASSEVTIPVNTAVSTVSISGVPTTEQNEPFPLTVIFSKVVTGFATDDLTVTGEATATDVSGSGTDYTVTITPNANQEGDVTVQVNADAAENGNIASPVTPNIHVDTIVPTASISISGEPGTVWKNPFDLTITFDEAVTGFTIDDVNLTGPATKTLKSSSSDNTTFVVTITPNTDAEGDVKVKVNADAVTDAALNANPVSSEVTIPVDTMVPTVSISGAPAPEQKRPFALLVRFSEAVTGFATEDLTVTGEATATAVAGSGQNYTVTITPNANQEGDVTVQVNAGTVIDAAGNGNTASTPTGNIHVDTIVPTPSISGAPTEEQKGPFDLTVTFLEPVNGFAVPADLTLTGPAAATLKSGTDGDAVYTVTITPNATSEGDVTVQVNAGTVIDAAQNGNIASAATGNIHVDTIVPTPSISGAPTEEQKDPFDLTVTFLEPVNGFAVPADLTLTGPAAATLKSSSSDNMTFVVTITPNPSADGDVKVKVNANAVTDAAQNANPVSSEVTIHVDTTVPTVSSISDVPTTEQKGPFVLTVTFSEDVMGFATDDLTVTGEATATAVAGSGTVYTVTITPNANKEGDVTVQVNADAVTDAALNKNIASAATGDIHVDTIVPTVEEISGVPTTEQKGPFNLTVTFSEDVTGFALNALTVTGEATATAASGSGKSYTVTITPNATAEGEVTVQVNAGAVTDAAGNGNTASTPTGNIHVDTIVPTVVSISDVPTTEQKEPFDLTIEFNEDVTGFATDDLTVTGEATATDVSGSGDDYTITITPNDNKEGDVTVQVNADAVTDAAGNENTASQATGNIHVDTIAPTVVSVTSSVTTTGSSPTKDPFDVILTFNEEVNRYPIIDTFSNPSGIVNFIRRSGDGGTTQTFRYRPRSNKKGSVQFRIRNPSAAADKVRDNAGNALRSSGKSVTVHLDTQRPTVKIEDVPSEEQKDPFDLTVEFNEDVTGFATDDLTVTGEATATAVSGSGDDYTVTITPNDNEEGDVTVKVNEDAVIDAAGNDNTASQATPNIHVDTIVPTVVSISDVPTTEQKEPFDLTIEFNEDVTGFATDDLTVTGEATATDVSGSGDDYTITITPNDDAEGDVTVKVNEDAVTDAAGNDNTESDVSDTVHVDTIIPTVTISAEPDIEKNVPFDLTITFSEEVNGFATDDVTVTGPASATSASGSDGDTVYTVTITPDATDEGDVTVTVNADTVQDFALNDNTESDVSETVHVDTIVPTVTISAEPDIEKNVPFDLTITFSEEVNGFATDDVTVTGPASATSASGSDGDTVYTVTITPDANEEGDVTVTVDADTVQDFALNDNTASDASDSVHVDTIVPTVAISGEPPIEKNVPFDITITFSEEVNGFAVPADLTVIGPASASLESGSNGDTEYTVTITPDATSEGDVTVTVNADTVQDFALNDNTESDVSETVHVDTIVPTVAISEEPDIEKNVPFDITITFDEPVNGFKVPDDLTVDGPASASLESGSNGDTVYTVTITPDRTSEGNVTVTVDADTVQDFALNDNTESDVSETVHVDTIVPTVAISGEPTIEKNVPFDLTIRFSEPVNGFKVPDDLTLTGPASASLESGSNGDTVYTVTITPNTTSEGDVTVRVDADTVQDFALNDNTASDASDSVHVDTIVPTVAISGEPTIEKNVPFDITITFSEEVNGFAVPADVTLTGPASASLESGSNGDTVYTVTITPNTTSEGDVTVTVDADTVQDFALNDNTESDVSKTVHVDTIVPTVEISEEPDIEKNVAFDITVTFSEPVNGFAVPADLTLTGEATATLASGDDGDAVYTVTISPNANVEGSDVTVTVDADTVKDFALNDNTASDPSVSVHVDTVVPRIEFEDVPSIQKRNDVFDIKVIFHEEVNDFEVPADMTLDGPATAEVTAGENGDTEYTVTVTPNPNARGDLTFQVNANAVRDFALNFNEPSAVTDAVRIDTVPPVAEITDLPTTTQNAPFDITITFNEQVNGFATEDIIASGPATALLTSGVDGDAEYTVTITPNPNSKGSVTIQIPAGGVKDFANNDNIASEISDAVLISTSALIVEITDVPEDVQLEAFSVMVKFSEDVVGFELTDIAISGDAVVQTSTLTGRGRSYMLAITPHPDTGGDVIIQVPADVAMDTAQNSNTASLPQTVSVAPSWMPDADVRAVVQEFLNLPEGTDFDQDALETLTTLESEDGDITDLTGLELATKLTTLDLSDNTITDIASLTKLTELTTLDLGGNAIEDIASLAELTELTTLDLGGNAIGDITSLAELTKLTTLDLGGNAIGDITSLAELTELTTLDLAGNAITDITPLAGLTQLETLNLSDTSITNWGTLATLTTLKTLDLSGNAISDLSIISSLTGLLALNLSDNAITELTPLANLTALTTLNLSDNTVSTLTTLASLTQLTMLNLNNNTVSDLTALGGLTNLTSLELAGNVISTLSSIATLQQLTVLDLRDNSISEVATLSSLASLTTLRLAGNPILDTAPLYALTQRVPPVDIDIAVSQYTPWDVNADGSVDAADSALVTAALGQTGDGIVNPRTDVNSDGTVDNADLLLVTDNFDDNVGGSPTAADILSRLNSAVLKTLDPAAMKATLDQLLLESDGSPKYRRAIALLQTLLTALAQPEQTRLLANYPNPFNPETWLPYQLAIGSNVEITIYDVKGIVVRHLKLGHQAAGYYTEKHRAAYWDGRNAVGERVASGVYFYQLQADNVSLLRKMVILK